MHMAVLQTRAPCPHPLQPATCQHVTLLLGQIAHHAPGPGLQPTRCLCAKARVAPCILSVVWRPQAAPLQAAGSCSPYALSTRWGRHTASGPSAQHLTHGAHATRRRLAARPQRVRTSTEINSITMSCAAQRGVRAVSWGQHLQPCHKMVAKHPHSDRACDAARLARARSAPASVYQALLTPAALADTRSGGAAQAQASTSSSCTTGGLRLPRGWARAARGAAFCAPAHNRRQQVGTLAQGRGLARHPAAAIPTGLRAAVAPSSRMATPMRSDSACTAALHVVPGHTAGAGCASRKKRRARSGWD